jgi:hypothetical protein
MLIPLGILASSGGAAGGSYELISTTLISTNTTSVTFNTTGLGSTYKHLQVRATTRSNTSNNLVETFSLRFNSDSGSNYTKHSLRGNGSAVSSTGGTTQTLIEVSMEAGGGLPSGVWAGSVIDILDPFSTNKNKTVRSLSGAISNGPQIAVMSGLWTNTSAVTSLLFENYGASFVAGSRFSLYGIKG